jgi:hypothetical protein
MGVFAASLGAAAFGAIHYMFLAGQTPAGGLFGVSYSVIVPIVLGAIGFLGAYSFTKPGTIREVVTMGSAAAIGFGIATYASWITPATAQARASAARASVPMAMPIPRAMPPMQTYSATANSSGVKLI